MMDKIWEFQPDDPSAINELARKLRVEPVVAGLLWRRGLTSLDSAKAFFNPSLEQLHDPFLMKDMAVAVEAIQEEIKAGRPLVVFGDYDVDGITGAALLVNVLRSLGAQVSFYVPDRALEGYGLSLKGIDTAIERGAKLMITCDCGITAIEQTRYAKDHGLELIITDHHRPSPELPPALAVLNPKRPDCPYPEKNLCGAGVAFKLSQALVQSADMDPELVIRHLDLVATGTAADLVPAMGENRIILKEGLKRLAADGNVGLRALRKIAGLTREELFVSDIVFQLGPRLNAVGRLGSASRAVELLTTNDPNLATSLSGQLNRDNEIRKAVEQEIVDEALRLVQSRYDPRQYGGLVLYKEGWHQGVIGIVASKLKERYWVPVVMITVQNGIGKGSARSLPGFDIYEAFHNCRHLLENFGGHTMAAGLTIKRENLPEFEKCFLELTKQKVTPEMMRPHLKLEAAIGFKDISKQLLQTLERLGPYGPGNMRPIFATRKVEPVPYPRLVGNNHLKMKVRHGGLIIDAIGFGLGEHYDLTLKGKPLDIAYTIGKNEWQGVKTLQLEIKDLRIAE